MFFEFTKREVKTNNSWHQFLPAGHISSYMRESKRAKQKTDRNSCSVIFDAVQGRVIKRASSLFQADGNGFFKSYGQVFHVSDFNKLLEHEHYKSMQSQGDCFTYYLQTNTHYTLLLSLRARNNISEFKIGRCLPFGIFEGASHE